MGSYPAVSPLPAPGEAPAAGGLFSVALSVGLPRPGVTWHPALWCPDFPHPRGSALGRDRALVPGHFILASACVRVKGCEGFPLGRGRFSWRFSPWWAWGFWRCSGRWGFWRFWASGRFPSLGASGPGGAGGGFPRGEEALPLGVHPLYTKRWLAHGQDRAKKEANVKEGIHPKLVPARIICEIGRAHV